MNGVCACCHLAIVRHSTSCMHCVQHFAAAVAAQACLPAAARCRTSMPLCNMFHSLSALLVKCTSMHTWTSAECVAYLPRACRSAPQDPCTDAGGGTGPPRGPPKPPRATAEMPADGAPEGNKGGWGWKGWNDRVAADPAFVYKVCVEQVRCVPAFACVNMCGEVRAAPVCYHPQGTMGFVTVAGTSFACCQAKSLRRSGRQAQSSYMS